MPLCQTHVYKIHFKKSFLSRNIFFFSKTLLLTHHVFLTWLFPVHYSFGIHTSKQPNIYTHYVCSYTHLRLHKCICTCLHGHTYPLYSHTHTSVYVCVYVYTSWPKQIYICAHTDIPILVCIYIYIYIYIHNSHSHTTVLGKCLKCNGHYCWTWRTVQVLDQSVSILHSTNSFGKGMNPTILPPAMGKQSGSLFSLTFMTTFLREE